MSTNATSPETLFGGTWQALDQGRVLIGANASHPAGSTGGAETHAITTQEMPSHNHSGSTNNTGSHNHSDAMPVLNDVVSGLIYGSNGSVTSKGRVYGTATYGGSQTLGRSSSSGSHSHTVTINNTGGGSAMSLMQPYLAVYMWERTA